MPTYVATWYLNGGHVTTREERSAHPSLTPSQLYRTKDGWIFIMCNKEKFWPLLTDKIGRPEWATNPRFATFRDRLRNRDELTSLLDEALSTCTTSEWIAHLGGVVPAAPVYDVSQAPNNPFAREGGRIAEFERAEGGDPVMMLASPIIIGGQRLLSRAAPALGAQTEPMLKRADLGDRDIAELKRRLVI